jgi:asparaginyl-tRNA synthetase
MERTKIHKLLNSGTAMDKVLIKGWVRTRRDSKAFSFLEINDGSCLKIQGRRPKMGDIGRHG